MNDLLHSPLAVVLVAAAATFVLRALGALLVGRIDPEGAVVRWFTLTSYALLAALVVRLVGLPTGSLNTVSLTIRIAAVIVTLVVWWATRRSILLGVLAGTACLVTAVTWAPGL